MNNEVIKDILEELFPLETNLVGDLTIDTIINRNLENKKIEIEETQKGDQLNYHEVINTIIDASAFIISLLTYLNTQKPKKGVNAHDLLAVVDTKKFKNLSTDKKVEIIDEVINKS